MKTALPSAVTALIAAVLPASIAGQQAALIEKRAAKQRKPVFQQANWLFDYDRARSEAGRRGKLMFAYFTRSYAY